MSSLRTWLQRRAAAPDEPVPWLGTEVQRVLPVEVALMRAFGGIWLLLVVVESLRNTPSPGLHGHGPVLVGALVALFLCAAAARPWGVVSVRRRLGALAGVTAAAAVIANYQPDGGTWQNGPLLVGLIAALWLDRASGVLALAGSIAAVGSLAVADGRRGAVLSIVFTAVPWYLVLRLMRELAAQRNALRESRAAEAEAAAVAERARLAREMHDVLAHSLSALALQLESTRLLAVKHGAANELTHAIDRAHQLAAGGLQEARRAIATARGDELPGPDRINVLADTFTQQSGLQVDVEVRGEPRQLPPDARLAVYRTAQEALTNVRRHAAAERVAIELSYLPQSTVLVVEDRGAPGTPSPPAGLAASGYGLTGMRERAELLGGALLAEPTATGFRVELRLPT